MAKTVYGTTITTIYDPSTGAPLDSRQAVKYLSDLVDLSTWKNEGGNSDQSFAYYGMFTFVGEDQNRTEDISGIASPSADNNGLYVLQQFEAVGNNTVSENLTNIANWKKFPLIATDYNYDESNVSLHMSANTNYMYSNELTSLNIESVDNSSLESIILFNSGDIATELTIASDIPVIGSKEIDSETQYVVALKMGIITIYPVNVDNSIDIENYYTKSETDVLIAGLTNLINVLQSEVDTLQSDVSTLQSEVDTLQSDVSTLQLVQSNSSVYYKDSNTIDIYECILLGTGVIVTLPYNTLSTVELKNLQTQDTYVIHIENGTYSYEPQYADVNTTEIDIESVVVDTSTTITFSVSVDGNTFKAIAF